MKNQKNKLFSFVVMSFDKKFNERYDSGIKTAIEELGYTSTRMDKVQTLGTITENIIQQIKEAHFIVADLSSDRPNCYYEVGYADALAKPVILMKRKGEQLPLDLVSRNCLFYSSTKELKRSLKNMIRGLINSGKINLTSATTSSELVAVPIPSRPAEEELFKKGDQHVGTVITKISPQHVGARLTTSRKVSVVPAITTSQSATALRKASTPITITHISTPKKSSAQWEYSPNASPIYPEDPQKGRWGGVPLRNGRVLKADVEVDKDDKDWFDITLEVVSLNNNEPVSGEVVFHLHDTFRKPTITVPVKNGRAVLELVAWGAFTVGVEADNGKTQLELDLSENKEFPKKFRER